MSKSNIIKENNKKLFESRLQMKSKSGIKNDPISFENKRYNDAISILNNSQPFTKIIFQKQLKNRSTLDSSFLNSINNINNSTLNNKIIKINKINPQRNKKININISHNKSNILPKDNNFFDIKKSPKNYKIQNKTIINVNKRLTKQNSKNKNRYPNPKINPIGTLNLNIKKSKKKNRNVNLINSITRSMTTINETNNNITINNSNYIMNNTNININNINNGNNGNNRSIIKEKYIPKFKIINDMYIKIHSKTYKSNLNSNRDDSNSNKKFNKNNSFLMNKLQKIEKINLGKNNKINLNNKNFNKKLNEAIFGRSLNFNINQKGRNNINLFKNNNLNNKKTIDICKGQTQRNLFLGKYLGKLLQKNNNYSIKNSINNSRKKNHNITLNFENYNYYDYENEQNIKKNINIKDSTYLNKILLNEEKKEDIKLSRNTKNNINNKRAYNKKFFAGGGLKTFNKNSNKNIINNNLNSDDFVNNNCYNIINKKTEFNDIDKGELINKFNINGNDTNNNIDDDFFSTEKNKKINDSSIDEDSGILSMNEVQDIIHYNDMYDIRKEYNFLFNYKDYDNFIEKYRKNIYKKFFDSNIDNYEYNQYKLKSKKKYYLVKDNNRIINKDNQIKNDIGFIFLSNSHDKKRK